MSDNSSFARDPNLVTALADRVGFNLVAATRAVHFLEGFEAFKTSPESGQPDFSAWAAGFRCVDPRCATAHVLGLDRGTAFVTSSPGAIIEDVAENIPEPIASSKFVLAEQYYPPFQGDQLLTTLRIAAGKLDDDSLIFAMPHSNCKAVADIIDGTSDHFLQRQSLAIWKRVDELYQDDKYIQAILRTDRSEWTTPIKDRLCEPIEHAIAHLDVERLHKAFKALGIEEGKRPPILGIIYKLGGDSLAPRPSLTLVNGKRLIPISDIYEELSLLCARPNTGSSPSRFSCDAG